MVDPTLLPKLVIEGLILGSVYGVLALGLNLMYSTSRLLNIAHGDLVMLGAYITFWLFTLSGVSPLASSLVAGGVVGLIGIIGHRLLFRGLIRTSKTLEILEANSILIFFSFVIIIESATALIWASRERAYSYLTYSVSLLGINVLMNRFSVMIISFLLFLFLILFLTRTWIGRGITYVKHDKVAAQIVGVNVERIQLYASIMGFFLAGFAGSLISMIFMFHPFVGISYTIAAFAVFVLGGIGSVPGSLIGGIIFGFVETVGVYLTTPGLTVFIRYLAVIAVLVIKPKGILGRG